MLVAVPALQSVEQVQAAEVFQVVYGAPTLAKRLRQPHLSDVDDFVVTPRLLVRLAADRYALISSEDADTMTHAAAGAIAIAYVERTPQGWRLTARWDEFAWTGGTGRAGVVTAAFPGARAPRAVVTSRDIHQGYPSVARWTIALEKDRPRLVSMTERQLPPEPLPTVF